MIKPVLSGYNYDYDMVGNFTGITPHGSPSCTVEWSIRPDDLLTCDSPKWSPEELRALQRYCCLCLVLASGWL